MDKRKYNSITIRIIISLIVIMLFISIFSINGIYNAYKNMNSLYNDRILPLEQLKIITDAYNSEVKTIQLVLDKKLTWDSTIHTIKIAEEQINQNWEKYKNTYLTTKEAKTLKYAEILKANIDLTIGQILKILSKKQTSEDETILKRSFNERLIQKFEPFTFELNKLILIQIEEAKNIKESTEAIFQKIVIFSILVFLTCILLIWLIRRNYLLERNSLKQSEELEKINNELTVTIEELQTTNEELDASNEELYATNEEIKTLNEQLSETNQELEYHKNQLEQIVQERTKDYIRENRFNQELINSSPTYFVAISPEGKTLMMNPAMLQAIGYDADEIIGKDYIEIVPQEDRTELNKVFQQLTIDLKHTHNQNRIITKTGQIIDVEWYGSFVTKGTDIDFFFGIGIDITQRKNIQESLRLSEEKFSAAFYASPVAKSITDPTNGIFIECNEALIKLTGYSREELIGHSSVELGIWINTEERQKIIDNLKLTGSIRNHEIHYKRKDGKILITKLSGEIITYNNEKYILSVIEDITEHRKAIIELEQSERKYRNLHLSMMDGYVLTSIQGSIKDSNKSYQDMLGYTSEELSILTYQDLTPEKWHAFENDIITNQVLIKGYSDVYEKEYIRKDGTIFPVELHTFLLKDEAGKNEGLWAIVRDITIRKKAEKELAESQIKLSAILESTNDMIWAVDANSFNLINYNSALEQYYRRQNKSIYLGISQEELLPEPYRSKWIEYYKRALNEGAFDVEYQTISQNRILFLKFSPLVNCGKTFGISVFARDITSLKKAHEELLLSEEKFSKAFNNSPIAICISKIDDGTFIECNDPFCRLFDYTHNEMVGKTSIELGIWYNNSNRAELINNLKTKGRIKEQQVLFKTKNGTVFEVQYSAEIIKYSGIDCLLAIFEDITERKKAEEELKILKYSIDNAPDGAYWMNKEGQFLYVNEMAYKMLGYTREELMQMTIFDINPIVTYESWEKLWQIIKENKNYSKESIHKRKDGSEFPIELTTAYIEYNGKEYNNGFARDITNRKMAEDELRKLNETMEQRIIERTAELSLLNEELSNARLKAEAANLAKSDFLSNMSHELRTPLNAILGYTQLFQRDGSFNESQKKGLNIIHRSSEHLLQMINEVLDYAKIDAHKLELFNQPVLLIHLIKSVFDMVEIKAQIKLIAFRSTFDKALPKYGITDEKRLSQVLLNLLNNAVKFTHHGSVNFNVKMVENKIRFEIKDTGVGIEPNKLEYIFKPFFQVGEWKDRAEGTGLGLAISQNIIRMMGSEIKVTSTINRGSTFWFDLEIPFSGSNNDFIQKKEKTEELEEIIVGINGLKPKILIVDDKPDNIQLLVDTLQPIGFIINTASNGLDAISKVQEFNPNLILMDLLMPKMDGYEASINIRTIPQFKNIPIIAISASVSSKTKEQIIKTGFDGFLIKPVQIDSLLNLIQEKLKIDWLYNVDNEIIYQPSKEISFVIPPKEIISDLIEAVNVQNITKIDIWLKNAKMLDKNYQPFVEKIKELSENFKFEEIAKLLDEKK